MDVSGYSPSRFRVLRSWRMLLESPKTLQEVVVGTPVLPILQMGKSGSERCCACSRATELLRGGAEIEPRAEIPL